MELNISIVIPSFNGLPLLKQYLPSVLEECRNYKGKTEVIIVEDGGTDQTAVELPKLFPQVKLIVKTHNEGFAKTANTGIRCSIYPYVFMLNNDIEITNGVLEKLSQPFSDSSVFAVQAKMVSKDIDLKADFINVLKRDYLKKGFFLLEYLNMGNNNENFIEMDFASGGASLYDKNKMLALNLFDTDYSPFYFEDIDLSFRAKLKGYKIYFHPRAIVNHRHYGSTVKKHNSSFKWQRIHARNYYLFLLKNFTRFENSWLYPFTMPIYVLFQLFKGNVWHIIGFFNALYYYLLQRD